jgi:hypothetical protein
MLNKGNERPRIRRDLDKQHSSKPTWDDPWLSVWACIDNKWHFVIHNLAVKVAPAAEPVFFCRKDVEIARRGRCDIHLNYGPSGAMNCSFIYAWGGESVQTEGIFTH